MQVSQAMTHDVCVCAPTDTIRDCAKAMALNDIGAVPVAQENQLIGMVTDRDIAVRAIAAGKGPDTPVGEVLTQEVLYCFEDQDLDHIAKSMGIARIRRVPVLTRERRLVGILSLGDVALRDAPAAGSAAAQISEHGGPHSQSADGG